MFAGDTLTVAYNKPSQNPLKDSANNEAESLPVQTINVTARVTAMWRSPRSRAPTARTGEDEAIWVSVTFSEPVNVDTSSGRPSIGLKFRTASGVGHQSAVYKHGSGTNTLIFEYRVKAGNATAGEGVAVRADTLALNSGSITTARDGSMVVLTHAGLDHDTDHQVDGSQPAGSVLASNIDQTLSSDTCDLRTEQCAQGFLTGSHATGYALADVDVKFTGAAGQPLAGVTVDLMTGLPASGDQFVRLTNPASLQQANGVSTNFKFTAPQGTVLEPDTHYFVVVRATSGLVSRTGTTADDAGTGGFDVVRILFNRGKGQTGSWGSDTSPATIRVNGVPAPFEPEIRAIEIVSNPGPDKTYGEGAKIRVQVTFSRPVVVDTTSGTPTILVAWTGSSGPVSEQASYVSGSGTKSLLFEYTVTADDVAVNTDGTGVAGLVEATRRHHHVGRRPECGAEQPCGACRPQPHSGRQRVGESWCWCPTSTRTEVKLRFNSNGTAHRLRQGFTNRLAHQSGLRAVEDVEVVLQWGRRQNLTRASWRRGCRRWAPIPPSMS